MSVKAALRLKANLDDTPSHPKSILKQPSKASLLATGTPSQKSSLKLSSSKAGTDDKLLLCKPLSSNLSPIRTPQPAPVWLRTALCSTPPTSRGPKQASEPNLPAVGPSSQRPGFKQPPYKANLDDINSNDAKKTSAGLGRPATQITPPDVPVPGRAVQLAEPQCEPCPQYAYCLGKY